MTALWHAFSCSVRGAGHIRAGSPNQDCAGADPENGRDIIARIAVADGHGSKEYLRSDVGAKIAIETTLEVLWEFIMRPLPPAKQQVDLRVYDQLAAERLPGMVEQVWREKVSEHFEVTPLTNNEQEFISGLPARTRQRMRLPDSLYGTTLLGVMATPEFILYLQNGDGNILVLNQDRTIRAALPGDSRLIANETTSMASPHAWQDIRIALEPTGTKPPLLILAATDGYANSFGNDADFEKVPADLYTSIQKKGGEWTMKQIPTWLSETSSGGSADDISVAMLWQDLSAPAGADGMLE